MALTNRDAAELLAIAAEEEPRGSDRRKALSRASRSAFLWPSEIEDVLPTNEGLTGLRGVGPWIARKIEEWIHDGTRVPEPPPLRHAFLTLTEANRITSDGLAYSPRDDLQMHTTWSDGHASIEEMVIAARERGYEYIGITDHSQSLRIANGLDETAFRRQWQEIETLQAELQSSGSNFRVLRSAELNLDPDGVADMSLHFAAGCDVVLGSFHSKLRRKEDQTERYLAALSNPAIDILAHPRGRIYNFRLGLPARRDDVFVGAAENRVALEVDAYVDRQDLDLDLLRLAVEYDVYISIGSDAHHPVDLPSLQLGVGAVIAAGVRPQRVLNYMSIEELLRWRDSRRKR